MGLAFNGKQIKFAHNGKIIGLAYKGKVIINTIGLSNEWSYKDERYLGDISFLTNGNIMSLAGSVANEFSQEGDLIKALTYPNVSDNIASNFDDKGNAIIMDKFNYIYKFDDSATELWKVKTSDYIHDGVFTDELMYAVTEDGHVYVVDYTGNIVLNINTGFPKAYFIQVDSSGNIYVSFWNKILNKYDSTGSLLWSKTDYPMTIGQILIIDNHLCTTSADGNSNIDFDGNVIDTYDYSGVDKLFDGKNGSVIGVKTSKPLMLIKKDKDWNTVWTQNLVNDANGASVAVSGNAIYVAQYWELDKFIEEGDS